MNNPGQRIREERVEKGWSQQRLADEISKITKVPISRAAIAQWESGNSKTQKPANLFAAAAALGLQAQWVLNGLGDKRSTQNKGSNADASTSTNIVHPTLTKEQKKLLSLMKKMEGESRKTWLKVGELLSKSHEHRHNDISPNPERRDGETNYQGATDWEFDQQEQSEKLRKKE